MTDKISSGGNFFVFITHSIQEFYLKIKVKYIRWEIVIQLKNYIGTNIRSV